MIYPDTSFWVALRIKGELHHERALDWYEAHQGEPWSWSPWHRAEVFNTIRQLARVGIISKAEAVEVIRRFEYDLRADYFVHVEADWREVMRKFGELSAAHDALPIRSADLLHVAYAIETQNEVFVSFDGDQRAIAKAAGLDAPLLN
jgi:predicted nucleic acid-binding protein